jgi:hypothetical protein
LAGASLAGLFFVQAQRRRAAIVPGLVVPEQTAIQRSFRAIVSARDTKLGLEEDIFGKPARPMA